MPIQVFAELRTSDVTSTATISPAEPLGGLTSQSPYCTPSISVSVTIPAGGLRYVTAHIDYQAKGSTGYPSNASSTYAQGFLFHQTGTVNGSPSPAVNLGTTLTATGRDVTGIGGFALDTNLNPKGGLTTSLFQSGNTIKSTTTALSDGFYYLVAPSPGTYTVKLTNANNGNLATSPSRTLSAGLYQEADFTGLNPSDPDINGFVIDDTGNGVLGATVNLYNVAKKLMQSAVTSSSGHYAFRFSNPGTFSMTVTPPAGFNTPASATVTLRQFDETRVDFTLT